MSNLKNHRIATVFRLCTMQDIADFMFELNRYCDDSSDGTEQNLDLRNNIAQAIVTNHKFQRIIGRIVYPL